MSNIQLKEIQNTNDAYPLRINDKQAIAQLAALFSRNAFAPRAKIFSAVSGSQNVSHKDSVIFVDSPTGPVTLVFPQPNYWGSGRSPIFIVVGLNLGANVITLTSASGTFNGATAIPGGGGEAGAIVVSDGNTNYYGGVF